MISAANPMNAGSRFPARKFSRPCLLAMMAVFFLLTVLSSASAEDLSWGPAYYDYIVSGSYLSGEQKYYSGYESFRNSARFALYDMDRDGVSELIADNNSPFHFDQTHYVFSWQDGTIRYMGSIGGETGVFYYPQEDYPGLFTYGGGMGSYTESYHHLRNGELKMEWVYDEYTTDDPVYGKKGIYQKTEDDTLYQLDLHGPRKELHFYTPDEIRSMSVQQFMETDPAHQGTDYSAANSLEVPVQSGNGDNDIDARFGSDKAACLFLTGTPVSADQISLRAGDTFLFGGHDSHGVPQSRIEWTVLTANEYGALLLTKYVIDCVAYTEARQPITWEKCTLRSWMNDTFVLMNFYDEQVDAILTVRLQNPNNPEYRTKGGNNTTDRVFALSYAEAEKYLTKENINTQATETAIAHGAKLRKENRRKTVYWWLRTPGNIQERAMITSLSRDALDYEGNGVGTYFDDGRKNNTGVRPALWLSWDYINSHLQNRNP